MLSGGGNGVGGDLQAGRDVVRWLSWASGFLLYLLLAVVTTWPLVRHLDTTVVQGTEIARTVPLFNVWTVWWNVNRLEAGFDHYWDAPIFYPAENTFALSEPQTLSVLLAPVVWAGGSVFAAANVYLLVTLVLNAIAARAYLNWVGVRWWVALGGGAAVELLPIAQWQIGVQQLVAVWGVVWTWLAFEKLRAPTVGRAHGEGASSEGAEQAVKVQAEASAGLHQQVDGRYGWAWRGGELGLALSATMLTCAHHAVFLALLLGFAVPLLGKRLFSPNLWGSAVVALLVAGLICLPIVYHLRRMPVEQVERPAEMVKNLSAPLGDYAAVPGYTLLNFGADWGREYWYLSAGWNRWTMGLVGLLVACVGARGRGWRLTLAWLGLISLLLSCGPRINLWGWEPWWLVSNYVPGFAQVRNVFRFAFFVQIAAILLSAGAIDRLLDWCWPTAAQGRKGWHYWATALVAGLAVWLVVDPWPSRPTMGHATNLVAHQDWTSWLRREADEYRRQHPDERPGVLCLPMAGGNAVGDFEITADWMILGTEHGVPLANGYSGFFPKDYFDLRDAMWQESLAAGVANRLYDEGVRWIVVDTQRKTVPWQQGWRIGWVVLERVFQGKQGVDVYRIVRVE